MTRFSSKDRWDLVSYTYNRFRARFTIGDRVSPIERHLAYELQDSRSVAFSRMPRRWPTSMNHHSGSLFRL